MKNRRFNRSTEDVGNIVSMEHVNVTVPDQPLATMFYVNGLGFTRDPYVDFGPANVWINVGEQQFHLPSRSPQVLRGHVGVVVPDLDGLKQRLTSVARHLQGTQFSCRVLKQRIDVTCPWGNRIRCYGPGEFGAMALGIPYVELDVPAGTAAGIARFYNDIMQARATVKDGLCTVAVGRGQSLRYRETRKAIPEYDGHHIAIYVTNFSGPHARLENQGRITEESDAHQYRFTTLFDPKSGKPLFELEHEVRSLFHPMYARPLTNRNPAQSFSTYVKGRDIFVP